MTAEKETQKKTRPQRYTFTQAMYNWKPPKKGPEPKFGVALLLLFALVAALVVFAVVRLI